MAETIASTPVTTRFSSEHVDVRSAKSFDETVKALTAELGTAGAHRHNEGDGR